MTLRMYLTDQDQAILQFVEKHGFITISETQNMFFNTQYKGYEMARKHLAKLVGYEKLSVYNDTSCNKNVYHMGKKPTYHRILAMDYYSVLIKNGAHICFFKAEKPWLDNKYFSDAFCVYKLNNKYYFDMVEVVRSKNIEVKKYIELYDSKEAHKFSDVVYHKVTGKNIDIFPRLVIIDDVQHKEELKIKDDVKIIRLDYKLSGYLNLFV